ncbi:MAG: hypothetical protein EOL93_03550 [Epsilonproteobacteria bacterium]|nr:hypothetical protein [Campylobacterota bacterium]
MIYETLKSLKNLWLYSSECTVKDLITYVHEKKALRDAQLEAIEIYLYLKIKGENKPLWQLFCEGFFIDYTSLSTVEQYFYEKQEIVKLALYNFAKQQLPALAKMIDENKVEDYEAIVKKMFYDVNYSDYLLSLPMGAGKTYLMASFIYLDLYFALLEPENKSFAHNFLILIPSGLKNSIAPSLRSIAHFDGSWVLPKVQADKIKKLLNFDILDVPKTAKKSNLANNPNAAKVNSILPNPFGQIFVVNAEKVILDSRSNGFFETEEIVENELKQKLALIPKLSIFIDEVHHAASDDIKLRQVVSWWNAQGNITTVLGFSGTPYLKSSEKITIDENLFFKFSTIMNTVYYYPLVSAIQKFLKIPMVKSANLEKKAILSEAIVDFQNLYETKVYEDGCIAKCAIYCSSIADLEEVVYPHLVSKLNIDKDEILKFHQGNKDYKIPQSSEMEFRSLDTPKSTKRYVLLVQVGKEGWDCRSLTSVILSGSSDSPKNMVLQTSCRCLREADKNNNTALIWLNNANAKILNEQLQKEQNSSIEEINNLSRSCGENFIKRVSRMDVLELPTIDFYQLRIKHTTVNTEESVNTEEKLNTLLKQIDAYKSKVFIHSGAFENINENLKIKENIHDEKLLFEDFLFALSKNSFMQISQTQIRDYKKALQKIYTKITDKGFLNTLVDMEKLYNDIALCFSIKRAFNSVHETIKKEAALLIAKNLKDIEINAKLYPSPMGVIQILEADNNPDFIHAFEEKKRAKSIELITQGNIEEAQKILGESLGIAPKNKDKSFHYLPYDFKQSGLEKEFLEKSFGLENFKNNTLEIYYNGERGLSEFVIECYKKTTTSYSYIGRYTTDFLILKRDSKHSISKVLIVETKGKGYANDEVFNAKKEFVNSEFITKNNEAFGYKRFDFLYLEDSKSMDENLSLLDKKIIDFFKEN